MSLVTPSQSNSGDTIEASDINNPINQLAAVINGNIDATNIADNSVTATKVAANLPVSKLQVPYKFLSYPSAISSLNASGFTKVSFNTEEFDTGSNYDNTTNFRFTAPSDGFYRFSAQVQITAGGAGDTYLLTLYKNGVDFREGDKVLTGAAGTIQLGVHPPTFKLLAGDYIEVYAYNGTAGGKTVSAGSILSYFGGELVSTT